MHPPMPSLSGRAGRSGPLLALAIGAACVSGAPAPRALFDGKSLAGWHGDPRYWSVQNGAIVGSTERDSLTENTFLVSDSSYADFEIRFRFRLRNGNSGLQFRSREIAPYVVAGYQADIADDWPMGILYDERGRGILDLGDTAAVRSHVRAGDWNEYTVAADGPRIRQTLNGFVTIDYAERDSVPRSGVVALQLHLGPPMRIEFRDFELRVVRTPGRSLPTRPR